MEVYGSFTVLLYYFYHGRNWPGFIMYALSSFTNPGFTRVSGMGIPLDINK